MSVSCRSITQDQGTLHRLVLVNERRIKIASKTRELARLDLLLRPLRTTASLTHLGRLLAADWHERSA